MISTCLGNINKSAITETQMTKSEVCSAHLVSSLANPLFFHVFLSVHGKVGMKEDAKEQFASWWPARYFDAKIVFWEILMLIYF